jgi:hypothetical protein
LFRTSFAVNLFGFAIIYPIFLHHRLKASI